MRRSLPTFLCVALSIGLTACDEPVDGPTTEDELALYDFRGAHSPVIPNYPGNGDLTMTRASSSSGGGGDIDADFDIINNAVYRGSDGGLVAELSGDEILDDGGTVRCTMGTNGLFRTLAAGDGEVLYSALGPWVFEGLVDIGGLTPMQAYATLTSQLLVSFDDTEVLDNLPSAGDVLAQSSVELDFATRDRKLLITAMLDGSCGGDSLSGGL